MPTASRSALQALARALAARGDLDVIVTVGSSSVRELMATGTPHSHRAGRDRRSGPPGLREDAGAPGGIVTGLSMSNTELEGKRLDILRAAVPSLGRVMVLLDPAWRAKASTPSGATRDRSASSC